MKILITGAAGFIGSHLMDAYPEAVGFDNFLTGRRENCQRVMGFDILDRRELYTLANDLEPDVVIHCAASYSDPDLWHRDVDTNIAGCINAAAVAKHHDAHLVYFQTILPPVSSYAISKIAGEQYLRLSGVPITVLRLANIYGPRNISGPIPVFYKRLSEGLPCTVVNTTRDMVFISDVVEAVRLVIEKSLVGVWNVRSGIQTPISDLFTDVCEAMGIKVAVPEAREPDIDDVQGAPESAFSVVPDWQPVVKLRSGIWHTIDSYRMQGIQQTHTHLRIGATNAS